MDGAQLAAAVLQGVLGSALLLVGTWGRRTAPRLVPPTSDADQRAHLEVVYRRGGWTASVVGVVLLCSSVAGACGAVT